MARENTYTLNKKRIILALILALLFASSFISVFFTNRNLDYISQDIDYSGGINDGGAFLLRMISALLVFLSLFLVARKIRNIKNRNEFRLSTTCLIYFLASFVPTLFIEPGAFNLNFFYSLFVFIAIILSSAESDYLLIMIRRWIRVILLVSFFGLIAFPTMVLQPNYDGSYISLPFRFYGVASHANGFAPLMFVLMLLEFYFRKEKKIAGWFFICASLVAILLAQSKTIWIAMLVCALIYMASKGESRIRWGSAVIIALNLAFIFYVLFILSGYDYGDNKIYASRFGADDDALTGRLSIWEVALKQWYENPIFGSGKGLWSSAFRERIGMSFAFHGHNQVIELLATTGVVGLMAWWAYINAIFIGLTKNSGALKPFGYSVLALSLIRCMTEIPYDVSSLFSVDVQLQLVLLVLATASKNSEKLA